MSATKITQGMKFRFAQTQASAVQYQKESNGNQSETYIFIDITIDGSGNVGQIIFGSNLSGNPLFNSVIMKARPGGGIDFWNNQNTKIASLDRNGNFKTKGTITQNTTP